MKTRRGAVHMLLLHLINYPKRTVQSYGKSGKITTFAP